METKGKFAAITGISEAYDYQITVDVYPETPGKPLDRLLADPVGRGTIKINFERMTCEYSGHIYETQAEMDKAGYSIAYHEPNGSSYNSGVIDSHTGIPVPTLAARIVAAWNAHQDY